MKILGRDPIVWSTAVAAVVQFISAFIVHVSAEAQGSIAAVAIAVLGFIAAASLHDGTWAQAGMTVIKALIALGLAFGLKWTPEQQAEVMFLVQATLSFLVRDQVTAPVTASGQVIGATAH